MSFKIDKGEYKFQNNWQMYFHHVNDENWSNDSYVKVYNKIDSIDVFNKVHNNITNITAGMFFMMKEDIFPTYEDPRNVKGGFWSFKVSKRDANEVWRQLTAAMVGQTLVHDSSNMKFINGISVSPKINNCIFKIWVMGDKLNKSSVFTTDIKHINPAESQYKKSD